MSYHVYISYSGFKETPISQGDFQAGVKSCPELEVPNTENFRVAWLKGQKQQNIDLTVYGLIHAQNPSEELIRVMFKIAAQINADVYSERLKKYNSPEDWEKRTRDYRQKTEERRKIYLKNRHIRLFLWAAFIIVCLIIGWFAGN